MGYLDLYIYKIKPQQSNRQVSIYKPKYEKLNANKS